VPYQVVIGAKEAADDHVAVRLRDGRRLDSRPAAEVLARVGALVGAHRTDLWDTDGRV
jgi:threonyl-tRNA synthetase